MPDHFHFAVRAFACFLAAAAQALGEEARPTPSQALIYEATVETRVPEQPEIVFCLRVPEGHTAEKPTAKGVLMYCTWETSIERFRKKLQDDKDPLVAYAKKHQLALMTWSTAVLWKTGMSYDQIKRSQLRLQDTVFDLVARAWDRGAMHLLRQHGLPEEGFLLFGLSGGAHWSQRLAMRLPQRFLAAHIHVANSYDKPLASASRVLWLVSSGDLDSGRENAIAFYRQCLTMKFPMVLKIPNGLGHRMSEEVSALQAAFFDYALEVNPRAAATRTTPQQVMLNDLATSGLTGEMLSQQVFRSTGGTVVPEYQRVALPNDKFANVWGIMRK